MRLPVRIAGTASLLPGRRVTTAEICHAAWPGRDPADLEARCGIHTRSFADAEQSHAGIGAAVLTDACAQAGLDPSALDRVIFVNSSGADFKIPATANAVTEAMGLSGSCDCFDLNNACMGFMSAFDLASRCIATGMGPIGIVVVELLSWHIDPGYRRSYAVLADAAAAAVLVPSDEAAVLGTFLGNKGDLRYSVTLAHPGRPDCHGETAPADPTIQFGSSNKQITVEAMLGIETCASKVLDEAGLDIGDVDWVLPHQPNGTMFQRIGQALGVSPDQMVPVVQEIGSVGAASIPVSLDRLMRSGKVEPGHRVLMIGVGSGLSYGAALYQVA